MRKCDLKMRIFVWSKMSFGQSDCSVFKLAISQEYQGQSAWFFPCRYRMEEDKSWFENFYWSGQKCYWWIRMHNSWINNVLSENWWINLIFLMQIYFPETLKMVCKFLGIGKKVPRQSNFDIHKNSSISRATGSLCVAFYTLI